MSVENTNTPNEAPEPTGEVTTYSATDAIDELTAYYASQGSGADDGGEAQDPPKEEKPDEVSEPQEEIASAEETGSDAKTEEKAAEKTEEIEIDENDLGESDFDALDKPTHPDEIKAEDYPDAGKFAEKYPRQKKEFYEEAAQFAAKAKKGDEIILKIGGEELVEPVSKIATGLREGNQQSFFEGVVEAGSTEALLDVTGHSAFLALVKAKEWASQEDPELQEIGNAMLAQTDKLLEARFGEGVSMQTIDEFANLQKLGWLEAINRWKEQEFVDSDEFYELLAADKAPQEFTSLREKQKQTEAELEKARKQLESQESQKQTAVDSKFTEESNSQIEKSLTGVVWAKSVLKDLPNDTAELKEAKAEFRTILIERAQKAFRESPDYKILQAAYKRGDGNTLKFRESLTKALGKTIATIKDKNTIYERTIAQIYGKSRNFQLSGKKTANGSNGSKQVVETREPTETEVSEKKPMSVQEITEQMAREIAALG